MVRKGLDFFPLNTVLDDKIQLIEAEYGLKGFAIVVKLLQKIYRDEGYYCEWNDDVRLLFASSVGQNVNLVSDIVGSCLKRGLFDEDTFKKYGVLTSAGIQKRFFGSTSRRVSVEVENDYLLVCHTQIPNNVNILSGNVYRNQKNVCRNSQRKERKIDREIDSKEMPAAVVSIVKFYQDNMGIPITPMTMDKLTNWLEDVDESLIQYAIEQAVNQNKRTWAYVEAIIKNHFNAGRKTRAEAEDTKQKGSNAKPTKFSNFESRQFDYDSFEKRSSGG